MRQGADRAALSERVTWCRYVRVADVDAYSALGWVPVGSEPLHVPHGCYSIIMEYDRPGEPVEPKR